MSAPKPSNWEALCRAWNDPYAFAAELAKYYAELGEPNPDITEPRRQVNA